MMQKSDFVDVELSAAGLAFAGESGAVRISSAHLSYAFQAGKTVRVLTSEWSRLLARENHNGQPILQIARPATQSLGKPTTISQAPQAQEAPEGKK